MSGPPVKSDARFTALLSIGAKAAAVAMGLLELAGHVPRPCDSMALSADFDPDLPEKGSRRPDLECARCGLKVEVRWKRKHQVAMSDSPRRPFEVELGIETWVVLITPGGVRYLRVRDLAASRGRAQLRMNADREPYLLWPDEVIRPKNLPACRAG